MITKQISGHPEHSLDVKRFAENMGIDINWSEKSFTIKIKTSHTYNDGVSKLNDGYYHIQITNNIMIDPALGISNMSEPEKNTIGAYDYYYNIIKPMMQSFVLLTVDTYDSKGFFNK